MRAGLHPIQKCGLKNLLAIALTWQLSKTLKLVKKQPLATLGKVGATGREGNESCEQSVFSPATAFAAKRTVNLFNAAGTCEKVLSFPKIAPQDITIDLIRCNTASRVVLPPPL